jgi:hypothetical protein
MESAEDQSLPSTTKKQNRNEMTHESIYYINEHGLAVRRPEITLNNDESSSSQSRSSNNNRAVRKKEETRNRLALENYRNAKQFLGASPSGASVTRLHMVPSISQSSLEKGNTNSTDANNKRTMRGGENKVKSDQPLRMIHQIRPIDDANLTSADRAQMIQMHNHHHNMSHLSDEVDTSDSENVHDNDEEDSRLSADHFKYLNIVTLMCWWCCPLTGVFAVIYSTLARKHFKQGHLDQARRQLGMAEWLLIITFFFGFTLLAIGFAYLETVMFKDKQQQEKSQHHHGTSVSSGFFRGSLHHAAMSHW